MGNKSSTHRLASRDKVISRVQQLENEINKGKHSHPRKQTEQERLIDNICDKQGMALTL